MKSTSGLFANVRLIHSGFISSHSRVLVTLASSVDGITPADTTSFMRITHLNPRQKHTVICNRPNNLLPILAVASNSTKHFVGFIDGVFGTVLKYLTLLTITRLRVVVNLTRLRISSIGLAPPPLPRRVLQDPSRAIHLTLLSPRAMPETLV